MDLLMSRKIVLLGLYIFCECNGKVSLSDICVTRQGRRKIPEVGHVVVSA